MMISRWIKWGISGIIYSVVVFAFIYFFIYFDVIPNLWEGYVRMLTIPNMVVLSILSGFMFSTIINFLTIERRN